MGIDIIVVNYKTPKDLEMFCESLKEQEVSTITIVNNDPTPEDREVAEQYRKEISADVINNSSNVGYANAVNLAASECSSDYLGIFNADVILYPDSVKQMVKFMKDYPDVGIAGPRQVDSKNRITAAGIFGTNDKPRHRGWHKQDRGLFSDVRFDCVTVAGSALFVRRECWDELTDCGFYQNAHKSEIDVSSVGAMPGMVHYYEDTFLCYHARGHGWKLGFNGEVCVQHEWHQASPVGGVAEKMYLPQSRETFRALCDAHGIIHD